MVPVRALALTVAVLLLSHGVWAAPAGPGSFPARPITLVNPFAVGGSTDLLARSLAQSARRFITQPVVVENLPGAGGTSAHVDVARRTPDGYSLIMSFGGVFSVQPYLRPVRYKFEDFVPVIGLAEDPVAFAVHEKTPARSIREFIRWAEGRTIRYGSAGAGLVVHLSQAAFLRRAGVQGRHVPFEGAAPAVLALLGEHIDSVATLPPDVIPHAEAGKLRILGTFSRSRYKLLPGVQTFREQGYDLEFTVPWFILAPRGTPDEIVRYLHTQFKEILEDPVHISIMEKLRFPIVYRSPDQVVTKVQEEVARSRRILEEEGFRLQ